MSSRWTVPATVISQGMGSAPSSPPLAGGEEGDDRSELRLPLLPRLFLEDLLGGEEDIAHVVGATVDPQLVAELGLHRPHQPPHGAPERGGERTDAADAALLDQIEEGVGFAKAQPRAEEPFAPKPRPHLDVEELGSGGRQRPGPAAEHGSGNHPRILVSPTFPYRAAQVTIRPGSPIPEGRGGPEAAVGRAATPRRQEAKAASTG